MGTVNLKTGLSPAVWGAGVGVLLLGFVHFLTTAGGGDGLLRPIQGSFFDFIGSYFSFFFTTVAGLIVLVATIVIYIAATVSVQGTSGTEKDFTAVTRGLLIGIGSGMNGLLAYNIYGGWFGQTVGLILGIILFVLGFIAAFSVVSQSGVYQGFVGWLSWLAPMSWVVLGIGLLLLVISLILGLVGLAGVDFLKLGGDASAGTSVKGKYADASWSTGTFFLIGGLGSNANYAKTAYNMGNIAFIHRKASSDHTAHESGHNLSLFVFGWIVHLIGAVDENVIGYHATAFTELLAESHDPSSGAKLAMWV